MSKVTGSDKEAFIMEFMVEAMEEIVTTKGGWSGERLAGVSQRVGVS